LTLQNNAKICIGIAFAIKNGVKPGEKRQEKILKYSKIICSYANIMPIIWHAKRKSAGAKTSFFYLHLV
jgi:hypothetical protein